MSKKPNRKNFGIKSQSEAAAYRKSLNPNHTLSKTDPAQNESWRTDESSYDEPPEDDKKPVQAKNKLRSIGDWAREHLPETIIGGVLLALLTGGFAFAFTINRESGIHETKIENLGKNLDDLTRDLHDKEDDFEKLDREFNSFKAGTEKELENLKYNTRNAKTSTIKNE
jgi:hypothetical protein